MKRPSISRRALAIAAVLAALAVLLGWVALRSGPLAPIEVTVAKVESQALRPSLFGIGSVGAHRLVRVGPIAPGRLLRLSVDVGDAVKAGQRLGEIDPVDLDQRLRALDAAAARAAAMVADASARLAHAEVQAQRYEQLYAERATSAELLAARRQDLQVATAALAAARDDAARARADRQALREQRASLQLRSPLDGVVTAREVEPGSTLAAGQAVVEVVDPRTLWVDTRFDQISAAGLKAGLPARVSLRSRRGEALAGKVLRTELRADVVTEELLAKIAFDAPPLPLPPIGERVEVTVDLPPLPAGPVVPNAAVQRQGSRIGAWTVSGRRAVFVPLVLGRADLAGRVQVLDGLKAGDAIVVYSERPLVPNARVHVVDAIAGSAR